MKEALAIDAESAMANSSMGYVKLQQRKFDEAKKYLEKAVAHDQQNYMVFYRYAYTLSREFVDSRDMLSSYPDETARKIREACAKSIALKPDFPETYSLLAMVSLARKERMEEGIETLKRRSHCRRETKSIS